MKRNKIILYLLIKKKHSRYFFFCQKLLEDEQNERIKDLFSKIKTHTSLVLLFSIEILT